MAPSNPPSPASLESELDALKRAVAELQARVAALEQAVLPAQSPVSMSPPAASESWFGLTLVNRIGALTLAIGVLFLFKYAFDNHWIGAAVLVLLGALFGLLLIALAEWLRRRDQVAFAQGLAGSGVLTLYIAAYAAFSYFQLVPRPAGFVFMLAACVIAVALAFRYGSAALASLGFLGALLTPVLLRAENDTTAPLFYFVYLLLLTAASQFAALRDPRLLTVFLIPLNALWALLSAETLLDRPHPHWFAILAFALALIIAGIALLHKRQTGLFAVLYLTAHGCFLIGVLRELELWTTHHYPPETRWSMLSEIDSVFLGIYAFVMIASGVLRKIPIDRLFGLTLVAIVVVKLYLYDIWGLATFYRISAFVALGIILLAASYIYTRLRVRTRSASG